MMALLFLRRTLMKTMLVGAVMLLACLSGAARADEATAVKAVENLGGKVTRDDKLPGKPVIGVNLPATKVTDAGLKELKHLKHLTSRNLVGTDGGGEGAYEGQKAVTQAGLKVKQELKQMIEVNVVCNEVTDVGLEEMQHLKQVTSLNLICTGVTDVGLKELKDLKHLTSLNLAGCRQVTDAG